MGKPEYQLVQDALSLTLQKFITASLPLLFIADHFHVRNGLNPWSAAAHLPRHVYAERTCSER
jgi:hypothetical protein